MKLVVEHEGMLCVERKQNQNKKIKNAKQKKHEFELVEW